MASKTPVLDFLIRLARRQSAKQDDNQIIFPLCWQVKAILIFICASIGFLETVLGTAALADLRNPNALDPWYGPAIMMFVLAAIPLAILIVLPGRVIVEPAGLHQRFWWRREKFIPWSDFASAYHDSANQSIMVYGRQEPSPIKFLPILVDQPRFESELKNWASLDSIPTDI